MTISPFGDGPGNRPPLVWWTGEGCWTHHAPEAFRGVLSGSFNPLHEGHLRLQAVAATMLAGPVAFELAAVNADKPSLALTEITRRCRQFAGRPVAVTTSATFLEKSRLLPGMSFVMGADTALRVVQPRFYGGSVRAMDEALNEMAALDCSFLVAARAWERRLWTLTDLDVPPAHAAMFREIPPESFRLDVSSTDLRRQSAFKPPEPDEAPPF
jgi:hypothetical protein